MLHNVELNSLNGSANIVGVIKSRRLRLTYHVARMEEGTSSFKILTRYEKKDVYVDLSIDGGQCYNVP